MHFFVDPSLRPACGLVNSPPQCGDVGRTNNLPDTGKTGKHRFVVRTQRFPVPNRAFEAIIAA